jgi:hypothetical protein
MKRGNSIHIVLTAVLLLLTHALPALSEESKPIRHWYRLELQTGDTTYQCIGSSPLDEKEFAKQLGGTEFVLLDDVAYIDSAGKAKDWQEWDPKSNPRLYVNPQYVIFFNPMKDDPKRTSAGSRKRAAEAVDLSTH